MRLFYNGRFISCEETNRFFSVLAEKDGRIVYTGDDVPEAYNTSEKIDLKGKCVVPAFGDTHMHFESFAYFNAGLDVRGAADFNALGGMIRDYIGKNPKEKTILAFGCSAHTVKEQRLPEKADLDKITTHPIMIVKYDGHASVANSAMIKKLPSQVLTEEGFEAASGWFFLEAFYKAVNHISKAVSPPKLLKNLMSGSDALAKKGIGLVHTAEGVGFPLDLDVDLMRFAGRGLPIEFRVYFQTMTLKKVLKRKLSRVGGCFENALDGCFGSEDAALREPYTNNVNNKGVLFYTQDEVDRFVIEANREGLQVALHAIGDAAVEQALSAFEKALADHPRFDHRHIIIHGDLMDDQAIEKAAELGIHIAVQTPFLFWEEEPESYLESILGERVDRLIPVKSMLEKGLVVAGGSDAPTTMPDPLFGIYCACNHPNPDERIGIEDALRMHTAWCAQLSFDENERGTLSEGKTADFIILSDDIMAVPVEKIKEITVEDFYICGTKYESSSSGTLKLLFNSIRG